MVLDFLGNREKSFQEAQELFTLGDQGKVQLFVSALTIDNTYYILSQQLKVLQIRKVIRQFKVLVKILPINDKIIALSLDSDFKDFEDAIHYPILFIRNSITS